MVEYLTGAAVLEFRRQNNLSRGELAKMLDANITTLYNWEHDKTKPHLAVQKKFLKLKNAYCKQEFTPADFKALKKEYHFTNKSFAKFADLASDTINRFSQGRKVNKFTIKLIQEGIAKMEKEINPSFNVQTAAKIITEHFGYEYLMEKFGVTRNTVYCWCSGRRKPIFDDTVRMQKLFQDLFRKSGRI